MKQIQECGLKGKYSRTIRISRYKEIVMAHKEESMKINRQQKWDFYFGVVPIDAKCLSTASKLQANSKKRKPESEDDCSFE